MSGIGRFKLSDALGKDGGASKGAKGKAKEKQGAKHTSPEATARGHLGEAGRANPAVGHQKVVGSGRGG